MLKISFLILISFSILLTSCATILGNKMDIVDFKSDPQGAKIMDNGSPLGRTPLEVELDKKKPHIIEFQLDGYQSMTKIINSSVGAGWIVADILLSGLIGIIVDASTDSWNQLDQDSLYVFLEKTK